MKYLITGLGNIGDEYANTRHNIGFVVADALAQDAKVSFDSDRLASVAKFRLKGHQVTIIKPTTYMNLSGKAVRYWMQQENIPVENILIVTDDVDLPPGSLRMRPKGSGGSHNGMNSVIEVLGSNEFPRLRFGIGSNYPRGMQIDYVLGRWTKEEEKLFIDRVPMAVEMIKTFVLSGVANAMNSYNNK